jgi:hypothetical protein
MFVLNNVTSKTARPQSLCSSLEHGQPSSTKTEKQESQGQSLAIHETPL